MTRHEPQAFPGSPYGPTDKGMSLRQWYAGLAMASIIAARGPGFRSTEAPGVARMAADVANEMMQVIK